MTNKLTTIQSQRQQLLEKAHQLIEQHGVNIIDPARFDLRGELEVGTDVTIDINVIIEGQVRIGSNTHIGANVILRNCSIGDNVNIEPNSLIEDSEVAAGCAVGPYARLRPGSKLEQNAKVGNFVEMKKSTLGEGSKANHLSYIGDTTVGKQVNIGAGTITCNYDGVNKYQTTIQDGAFIGSNTALVAPVTIGSNATIGAGSTISKDTPDEQLTVARAKQVTIKNWQRAKKQD